MWPDGKGPRDTEVPTHATIFRELKHSFGVAKGETCFSITYFAASPFSDYQDMGTPMLLEKPLHESKERPLPKTVEDTSLYLCQG